MSRRTDVVVDLTANLVVPFVVLTWLSGDAWLGPKLAPAVAALGPIGHIAYRRVRHGKASPLSGIVLLSVAINGVLGFVPVDAVWFAVKEAAVPVALAAWIAASLVRGPGVVAAMIEDLLDPSKVRAALAEKPSDVEAAYASRLRAATVQFAGVMALSGVLSGALALWMVRHASGTAEFAAELGKYTAWSWGLVNLPTMLLTAVVLRGVLVALEDGTGKDVDALMPD